MTLKRTLAILVVVFAFSALSFAQAQTDDVRITSGPTVNASDHSADIRWETNNKAATFIRYGKDASNMDKESRHSGGARDHQVTLAELEPGTTYHFVILTDDGKERTRGQFTTKGTSSASTSTPSTSTQAGAGDDDVRVVEGPFLKELGQNTAVLFWRTNNVAASDVKYGTDPNNLDKRAYEPGGAREHELRLSDLEQGRTYYFQILTRKGEVRTAGQFTTEGTGTVTTAQTGQTAEQQAQNETIWQRVRRIGEQQQQGAMNITQGPVVEMVSDNSAIINWTTSGRANSVVRYGENPNALSQTAQGGWGDQHRVTITGLKPSTTYYFRAESAPSENTGTQTQSTVGAFRTVNQGEQARSTAFPR
jgi:phosphodiesterase/alkaline phosphatase D-like protein